MLFWNLFLDIYLEVIGLCILLAVKVSNIAVKILSVGLSIVLFAFLIWHVKKI